MELNYLDLGLTDYRECLAIQTELHRRRVDEDIPDTLILTEHHPVLTMGIRGDEDNILVSCDDLKEKSIEVVPIKRGGDVTFHGPGQIVGYPIIKLREANLSPKSYLDGIQRMFIDLLWEKYQIHAHTEDKKYTGIWVQERKITAIGIQLRHHVTMHGFAYNVNTDMSYFELIHPCGLSDRKPTSLQTLLDKEIDMNKAKDQVLRHFEKTFPFTINQIKANEIL